MIVDYLRFSRHHWRHLLFGIVLMGLSSLGQTYYISLFGEHLRADYQLSSGGLGSAYAFATLASAMTLTWVGRWIDRTSVERFTLGVALVLSCACVLMALSRNVAFLVVSFYFLRLGGQGLMVHTAQTTIARLFPVNRGKALSLSALGIPLGEALLPILVVTGMLAIGWRNTWYIGSVVVILGALFALHFLPAKAADVGGVGATPQSADASIGKLNLWADRRLWFTLPALLATPFVVTGFFFHQARLVDEKGWSLTWVATCFVGYAAARAVALLAIGPVIDRLGAVRILPYFLLPLGMAAGVLAFSSSAYAVPLYLVCMGMSAGTASVMATSIWVELYGVQQLARVRSSVAAADVVASGISPVAMGWLIDVGVPLSRQALICIAGLIVVSLLARRVGRFDNSQAVHA